MPCTRTRAAVEEGICPVAAWPCSVACQLSERLKLDGDEQIGADIIRRAVEAPLRALASNAGVEGSLVVQEVKRRKGNEGYNVTTGQYEDLVKAGVVDPRKSLARRCRMPDRLPVCC